MDEFDSTSGTGPAESGEEHDRQSMPVDLEQPPRLSFPVVGIGASAGGLESFTEFFKAMPANSGMSFVLIQHLPPDRESLIAEILQRHTEMPVQQVQNGMAVEPNQVYVIRPGHTLTIKNGHLHLGDKLDKPRHSRPVDDFFKSLAEEQRERAICIIMSGMGSNGSAGAQAIKATGGLCIAQEPESAQFPSMPRHLIDAGYADFILPPAEMPEALIAYASHPYASENRGETSGNGDDRGNDHSEITVQELQEGEQQSVREILAVVRTRTRFDFSGYKKPTVLRRIQRRMGLNRITDLGKYAKLLRQSPTEVAGLADDLLIHVTGFFRDSDAWESLRQHVIIPLVQERPPDGLIRCWVAACSSGEEAYSLAMLLVEEAERAGKPLNIKVFATDTAERTLGNARNGIYPGGIEAEMPPERLQRFFDKEDAVYRVRQDLRERVVFAPQNMLNDPPFSRLDIVTCRNLLIYLEPQVQTRVFSVVHFGLKDGGALFLGTSETAPAVTGFQPIDKKARIYRRVGPTRHGAVDFPRPRAIIRETGVRPPPASITSVAAPSVAQLTSRALVAMHVPAAVTVDRNYRVVYYHGETKPYLRQPTGEPTQEIIALASDDLRASLRMALRRAMADNTVHVVPGGWIKNAAGQLRRVLVTASPATPGDAPELFVVSFQELDEVQPAADAGNGNGNGDGDSADADTGNNVRRANEELQRLRDELQSAIEELHASNEEHKAATEEAMSMNEELQSSNEELETSKEEMQSLNEELSTVNAQLQAKMDELQKTSSDLRSLLTSTDIAVIFLDSKMRIRRYTPPARNLLELIGSDVGRPLSDLAKKFADPDLLEDAQVVLERLTPAEREVRGDDGRWYARRVLPYRTSDDRIEGVVITFVDISDRKRAQALATQVGEVVTGDLKAMDSLHAVSNLLIGAKDMHAVLAEILAAALDLNGTDLGDIQLCDPGSCTLQVAAQRGFSDDFIKACGKVNLSDIGSPAAKSLRQRSVIIIQNIRQELSPASCRELLLAAGAVAVYCSPLVARGGELLGVLSIYFRQSHAPDERALRISELLSRQGADTIERMRIEEELSRLLRSEQVARRALDEAAQMKDEFIATLSHELRTPLSAILLWGNLLRSAEGGGRQMKDGLAAIIDSAQSQARLLEDLLDTSRITSGKLRLELAETDLVSIVRSVIEQNEPAATAKQLRVEAELSPAAGVVVADPIRIRQVVWNLLTNATKFTPSGGRVSVSLGRSGNDVVIGVSDSGPGIPADFLPHIFDRFRQYEASITRQHGGLGLGLAISKQLVELHGGTIHAESGGANQGATFTVRLPLPAVQRPVRRKAAALPPPGHVPLSGVNILLIEDDPETQRALRILLQQAGATVKTAATGAAGFAAYRKNPPQIILSDLGLPDFDGSTLLTKIRAEEARQNLPEAPAIALSAYAREEDRKKATDAGYRQHIAKPIDGDKLIAALVRLIPAQ